MRRFLSIMMIIAVLVCSCSSFGAASVYRFGDWTLTVLSTADDAAFGVRSYDGTDEIATVPNDYGGYPIIALNAYAFAANKTVREVVLGENITSVGNGAFLSATALEKVTAAPSLTQIGESAFSDTPALKEVNLGDSSVERIGVNTFLNSGIEEIALPETCTAISDNAFAQCRDLVKIEIPDSVTDIGDDAFRGSDNVVIYGTADSYAIEYAKAHGIDYVRTNVIVYLLGDADADGSVLIFDATAIQRLLLGMYVADLDTVERNGDVTGDGLDISDATWIQRYVAEMDIPYPVGSIMEAVI